MPRSKDVTARAETSNEIKAIARQQLAEKGTNGISLRGIARELGVTAPAIYNYFPKLDDLITALLVDAFNGHADAIQSAMERAESPIQQLKMALWTYRQWALDHPSDFQLIYGNPIPGYEAPREVTVPLASRPQELLVRCLVTLQSANLLVVPDHYNDVPETISNHVEQAVFANYAELQNIPNAMALFYMMEVAWTRIHGMVMLEIHEHLGPTIGDVDSFVHNEIDRYCAEIGVTT